MLNENKIRLMTGISMLEKKKGKELRMVHRHFCGDYISLHLLRSFLGYSFCWCLGMALVIVCKADEILSGADFTDLTGYLYRYGVWYAGGLAAYLAVTAFVSYRRYRRASAYRKIYLDRLKRLERRYEYQDRRREPGKEVRKS